uniref:Reverse transcriptase Ty1/copia-type domain-containing protein n=1 Tax=Tanacetum cinerariifolium TaxID=118510 RepID=A0A6L2LYH1_TANCI|nr:hypothetical protein [Tanacetum cinerariifolium]
MISKEASRSNIDLEEIQEYVNEKPIVNTHTQQEVVTPIKPDDISLPIRRTSSRVSKAPQFYYGFHIEEHKISDSTLSELDDPTNYKEAMVSPEVAKWKEAMKSEIQSMYDNQIYKDRSKRLIRFSQDTYLDKTLKRFKMDNSMKGNLPLHHGIKIRSIMYAMTCTRPDVSFALSMVSQHQQNPSEEELGVTSYCDASWQTDRDDSHLQSGWIFLLNRGAVTWKSSKQDTSADSTCEFEYIGAYEASKEAIWMKNFIGDLGVVPIVQDPIEIFCDNESANPLPEYLVYSNLFSHFATGTGGKLHDRNAKESWAILEDLILYDNESWNDLRDFAKPVKAISLPQDVPSTSDHRLIELKNQVQRLMEAYLAPKLSGADNNLNVLYTLYLFNEILDDIALKCLFMVNGKTYNRGYYLADALAPLVPDSFLTSWTNRNPGRHFYGCPTLSPTCVDFLRWYDPPMYQRSVQIILGLLRSRNELEEILALVEEN